MSQILFLWRPSEPAHYNSKSLALLTAPLQMTTHRLFWQCGWFHQLLYVHRTVLHWKHWLIHSMCCGCIEKSLIQRLIPKSLTYFHILTKYNKQHEHTKKNSFIYPPRHNVLRVLWAGLCHLSYPEMQNSSWDLKNVLIRKRLYTVANLLGPFLSPSTNGYSCKAVSSMNFLE